MATNTKLGKTDGALLDTERHPYTSLVGGLLFLATTTRPDIMHAVTTLTRYMAKPTTSHWEAAKRVVRYLSNKKAHGLIYGATGDGIIGYTDSDYASDITSRRSTTGYVFTINGTAVSWASKLQPTIAVSTTEAEYMAAAAAIKEALWLRVLLKDLDHNITGPMIMYGDNQGAIKLLKNPVIGPRSKHIDVVHHFARERVMRGEIDMCYIPTDKNMADAFTKPLPNLKFAACCSGIGTVSQPRLPAHVLWCTAAAACFKLHSGRRGLQQRWPDLVQGGAAEQPATHMRWHKHGKHQAGTTEALLTCLYGQRHTGLALSGCSVSVPSAARLGLCCTNTPSTCLLQPGGLACARATRCKQTGCQTPFLTA
jgi:hypothetical protein